MTSTVPSARRSLSNMRPATMRACAATSSSAPNPMEEIFASSRSMSGWFCMGLMKYLRTSMRAGTPKSAGTACARASFSLISPFFFTDPLKNTETSPG